MSATDRAFEAHVASQIKAPPADRFEGKLRVWKVSFCNATCVGCGKAPHTGEYAVDATEIDTKHNQRTTVLICQRCILEAAKVIKARESPFETKIPLGEEGKVPISSGGLRTERISKRTIPDVHGNIPGAEIETELPDQGVDSVIEPEETYTNVSPKKKWWYCLTKPFSGEPRVYEST